MVKFEPVKVIHTTKEKCVDETLISIIKSAFEVEILH
jgi:hypothetical protein